MRRTSPPPSPIEERVEAPISYAASALSRRALALGLAASSTAWLLESRIAQAAASRELFNIARSKNANVVKYAVRLGRDGSLDLTQPVEAYWQMLAESGQREELTWAERKLAYGFSVRNVSHEACELTLTACPRRSVSVRLGAGQYRALATIAGKLSRLTRIFVRADDKAWLPHVEYVELSGTSLQGEAVRERIAP